MFKEPNTMTQGPFYCSPNEFVRCLLAEINFGSQLIKRFIVICN